LAVGFIIGTYTGKVVSALVFDIIMPIPGAFMVSSTGVLRLKREP